MAWKNLPTICCSSTNRQKSFYCSIRPLLISSRCFGLSSFSIKTNLFGEVVQVKFTLLNFLWFSAVILLFVGLICFNLHHSFAKFQLKSLYVLTLAEQILMIKGLTVGVVNIIIDVNNRERILRTIEQFTAFDKEVMRSLHLSSLLAYVDNSHNTLDAFIWRYNELWWPTEANFFWSYLFNNCPDFSDTALYYCCNSISRFAVMANCRRIFYTCCTVCSLFGYKSKLYILDTYFGRSLWAIDNINGVSTRIFSFNDFYWSCLHFPMKILIFLFLWRKRFLNTHAISDIELVKQNPLNSVDMIRRIGRLHDLLCTIMDGINSNYSFQVAL